MQPVASTTASVTRMISVPQSGSMNLPPEAGRVGQEVTGQLASDVGEQYADRRRQQQRVSSIEPANFMEVTFREW